MLAELHVGRHGVNRLGAGWSVKRAYIRDKTMTDKFEEQGGAATMDPSPLRRWLTSAL